MLWLLIGNTSFPLLYQYISLSLLCLVPEYNFDNNETKLAINFLFHTFRNILGPANALAKFYFMFFYKRRQIDKLVC
jgi:hypothetical protein